MGLTRIRAEQISDIDYKQAVRVIELNNVTLSGGAPLIVDGVTVAYGDRILVSGQNTASQNGIYDVTVAGSGSNGTWIRTSDANATGEINAGMIVMVTEGTTYADTSWKLITNDPIVIGTTGLVFAQNTGNSFGVINANGTPVVANGVTSTAIFSSGNNLVLTGNATSDTITFAVSDTPIFTTVSATGNISGSYLFGNGSQITGLPAGYSNADVATYLASNSNVTITSTGNVTTTANISGNYILGNGALLTGVITSVANINSGNSNVTVVSSGGNVTVGVGGTNNVAVFSTTGEYVTGIISASGNIFGGGIRSTSSGTAPSDPSVGDFWYNTSTNVQYRFTFDGTSYYWIDDFGSTTGVNGTFNAITNGTSNVTAGTLNGNITVGIGGTPNVIVWATTGSYVTGVVSATGNITGGNLSVGTGTITVGNIVNANGNAVGNIGSSSNYFNTVFANANSALYADLAEIYIADDDYEPGTLVIFGGEKEITVSDKHQDTRVAGVISTDPAYLMNSGSAGLPVALTGRIPCKIVGSIQKGDRLVTSGIKGVATVLDPNKYQAGCIIGKALQEYNSNEIGVIEIAVGRY